MGPSPPADTATLGCCGSLAPEQTTGTRGWDSHCPPPQPTSSALPGKGHWITSEIKQNLMQPFQGGYISTAGLCPNIRLHRLFPHCPQQGRTEKNCCVEISDGTRAKGTGVMEKR